MIVDTVNEGTIVDMYKHRLSYCGPLNRPYQTNLLYLPVFALVSKDLNCIQVVPYFLLLGGGGGWGGG